MKWMTGIVYLAIFFAFSQSSPPAPAPDRTSPCPDSAQTIQQYYSLQVSAVPVETYQNGLLVYEELKQKGYCTYYFQERIKEKDWVRVRVGYFADREQAEAFGREFQRAEGRDYFIARTPLHVHTSRDQCEVVTTPSGIWKISEDQAEELYHFETDVANRLDMLEETQARISPSTKEAVFYYDSTILLLNLETGKQQIVKKDVLNSDPQWSPDGSYLGYLDVREWEVPTSLWNLHLESGQETALVQHGYGDSQLAVKSFQWHPHRNLIFFVEGHAYGTLSVGGSLYLIDMEGNRQDIVIADTENREEVEADFFINEGTLVYSIARFDEQYTEKTCTTHEIDVNSIQ